MTKSFKFLLLFLITLGSLVLSILFYAGYKINSFTRQLGQTPLYFINTAISSYKQPLSDNNFNLLILGMDYRDDWLEKNQNTDTLILASHNSKQNKVHLISFPRDLWDETTGQKINLLYEDALKSSTPISSIKSHFKRITGQEIDRILVLTTENIEDFIGIVGGVDIFLDNDYIDKEYPNPEYIDNNGDAPMYITVEYKSGWNHIDSTNITPFVRSRKGGQTLADGGTDLGRIRRQQQLLDALIQKTKNPEFIKNKDNLIKLYNFWHKKLQTDLSDKDLFSLLIQNRKNILSTTLEKTDIPVGNHKNSGLIYHPDYFKNKQWVFLPTAGDFSEIHLFVSQSIDK